MISPKVVVSDRVGIWKGRTAIRVFNGSGRRDDPEVCEVSGSPGTTARTQKLITRVEWGQLLALSGGKAYYPLPGVISKPHPPGGDSFLDHPLFVGVQ